MAREVKEVERCSMHFVNGRWSEAGITGGLRRRARPELEFEATPPVQIYCRICNWAISRGTMPPYSLDSSVHYPRRLCSRHRRGTLWLSDAEKTEINTAEGSEGGGRGGPMQQLRQIGAAAYVASMWDRAVQMNTSFRAEDDVKIAYYKAPIQDAGKDERQQPWP